MAERKGFDLASALAAVSESDTTADRDRIVHYDIDEICPDPRNFYSLSDIDGLMASIELVGLQQPLLVRPHPDKPGAVVLVSGHRRREAIRRLVDDGRTDLRSVPCLVETSAASAELQELKLIYANSDTRRLTNPEISAQVERVEELLYKLKEQGYEFPGRMRDHVAEACKISQSKLARLKVIRDKLSPDWAAAFKSGNIVEATAYRLARATPEHQALLYDKFGTVIYEQTADYYDDQLTKIDGLRCSDGTPCSNRPQKQRKALTRDRWSYNPCTKCCKDCRDLLKCKLSCPKLADTVAEARKDLREAERQAAAAQQRAAQPKIDAIRAIWARWTECLSRTDMSWEDLFTAAGDSSASYHASRAKIYSEPGAKIDATTPLPNGLYLSDMKALSACAALLDTTVDYLLLRADDSASQPPAPEAVVGQLQICGWMPGGTLPREPGIVAAVFDYGEHWPKEPQLVRFDGAGFRFLSIDAEIKAEPVWWMQIPELPEVEVDD